MHYCMGVAVNGVDNKFFGRLNAYLKAINSMPYLKAMFYERFGVELNVKSMLDAWTDVAVVNNIMGFVEEIGMRITDERAKLIDEGTRYTARVCYHVEWDRTMEEGL